MFKYKVLPLFILNSEIIASKLLKKIVFYFSS